MKRKVCAAIIVAVWAVLAVWAWFSPAEQVSLSERRPLEQKPALTGKALLNGQFMADFEDYSLDQFPAREEFRTLKSLFHFYVLNQSDSNGIYLAEGMAVQQEYPLNETSVAHALDRFNRVYEEYLAGSKVYFAIVPDKGHYLAESSGHLTLDYDRMARLFQVGMPWTVYVDLADTLTAQDYYRTDTHWRQERLWDAAGKLCDALGVTSPKPEDYTLTPVERPFYGVYYGQAALPMEPETMYLLESDLLDACRVYDYESGQYKPVYDLEKLDGRDPYEVYLSGSRSLLTVENPGAATDRELIVFRDSFGSAIVPLLVQDYARVTLVDIRYIQSGLLDRYVDFHGQDVLFLYSTLVLNNSETIK